MGSSGTGRFRDYPGTPSGSSKTDKKFGGGDNGGDAEGGGGGSVKQD